ncbi:unannotated protein [freshwater metagenome]|uniref:Unannotated protein n=1 Tax=freshwater metagenome TaxID=449393 RepID=A0A6J7IUY2_9ZZZZ
MKRLDIHMEYGIAAHSPCAIPGATVTDGGKPDECSRGEHLVRDRRCWSVETSKESGVDDTGADGLKGEDSSQEADVRGDAQTYGAAESVAERFDRSHTIGRPRDHLGEHGVVH